MSARLILDVQYDVDPGEDMGLVLQAFVMSLAEMDGVTSIVGHGPSATVINDPRYDVMTWDEEDGPRFVRGTEAAS